MNADLLENYVKGSIIGLMVGDALGFPYSDWEQIPTEPEMIEGPAAEPPGCYQAPSALALCTMANINEFGGINPHDLIEKFHDFLIAGYMAPYGDVDECSDISEATVEAIKKFTTGMPPDRSGSRDADNECLTRMLPIGLWYSTESVDALIKAAHQSCIITHGTVECQVACAAYCMLVRNMLLQKSEKVFEFLADFYKTTKLPEYAQELDNLKAWRTKNRVTGGRGIQDCFWSAWKSHTLYERDYQFCVYAAVQMGNDANSTAAVAGSYSALSNGLNDIPQRWLSTVALTAEVMETISSFTNKVIARVTD